MPSFDRPIEVLQAQDDGDEDLQSAFDQFRDDLASTETPGTIRVFRLPINEHNQPVATKTQILLFTAPIDQYRLDEVTARVQREYFLPGENFIAIRIAGYKQGVGGNAFNRIIMIQRGSPDATPPGHQPNTERNDLAAVLVAMREDRNATNLMMQGFFERIATAQNQRPQIDPMNTAKEMITMVTGLAGVLARPASAAPGIGVAGSLKEMVETMVMIRDLGEQMGTGGKGDDNSAARIIEAVTPLAKPMLELMAAGRSAPPRRNPPAQLVRPQPVPPQKVNVQPPNPSFGGTVPLASDAPTPPPQESSPENDQMLFAQLRPQFDVLAKMASEGADPVVVAQMTLEQLPESADGPIFALLSDPNWLQKFVTINPVVNNHVEWFTKLRDALLAEFDTGDAANG